MHIKYIHLLLLNKYPHEDPLNHYEIQIGDDFPILQEIFQFYFSLVMLLQVHKTNIYLFLDLKQIHLMLLEVYFINKIIYIDYM